MARSGSAAARSAAVLLAVATLGGCAAQPLPAPSTPPAAPAASTAAPFTSDAGTATRTASPSVSPTASAPQTPSAGSSSSSSGSIGFGSIGALTIRMTARGIAGGLGATADSDTGNPSCAVSTFTGGSGQDAALARALSTLAESGGATGRVDVLELGVLRPVDGDGDGAGLPRTERGIGIGSTAAEVRRAYRGGLTETDGLQGPELLVEGPDGTALVFHVADDVVSGISTGRLPQVRYAEHCG